MTQCLLTLLLVPGLHEHHLLVFVPRSVGSVGAGDAPCPRGGWLDTPAAPAAPATVLHNGDTLPRPFVAALGSPQTLTTWSQPALSMPHDRSSLSLSLTPFSSFPPFFSPLYLSYPSDRLANGTLSFSAIPTGYPRPGQSPREDLLCKGEKRQRSRLESIETTSKQP